MHKCVDIWGGLIALILSKITNEHEKIVTYDGGPSSLITSICIMRIEIHLLLENGLKW